LTFYINENARDLNNNELLTLIQNVAFQKFEHPKSIVQKAMQFDFSKEEIKILEDDYYIEMAEKLINVYLNIERCKPIE